MTADESTLFASRSLREHYSRGAVGALLLFASFALIGPFGGFALLLWIPMVLAFRGCPTCWALGLTATRAKLQREACTACHDEGSRLRPVVR